MELRSNGASRQNCFDLRGEQDFTIGAGEIKRLDPEPVPR